MPAVDRGQSSDLDVYMERFAGSSDPENAMWSRVLHFKRAQPSSAGTMHVSQEVRLFIVYTL